MKVLVVTNAYPSPEKRYSGIFVRNQVERLRFILGQNTVSLFCMRRRMTSYFGSVLKYINAFARFVPVLFRRYDLVHLHFFVPLIFLVYLYKLFHPRTKVVVTFHGSDINRTLNDSGFANRLWRHMSGVIDHGIAVGRAVEDQVKRKLDLPSIEVLPVGVDESTFFPVASEKQYDFLFVGSFIPVKGIDVLLEAIKMAEPGWRYCIVGQGAAFEKEIQDLSDRFDISFHIDVTQEELAEFYSRARFLVLPSRSEGFPTVTVEAMFCGVPAVASGIPQCVEQIQHGVNGYLFEPENARDLADTLDMVGNLDDDAYSSIRSGALASFRDITLEHVSRRIATLYKQMVSESHRHP